MGLLDEVMDGINGKEGAAGGEQAAAGAEQAGGTDEKKTPFEYGAEFAERYGGRKGPEKSA